MNRREILNSAMVGTAAAVLSRNSQAAEELPFSIIDTNVSLFQWPFRRLPLDNVDELVKKFRFLGITQAWAGSFEAIKEGTIIDNKEGINKYFISCTVVTFLPIQSIVVVTSPIGDHAPPALAAITISPANHNLSSLFKIIFLKIVINTIVAVRLSMMAERIKARKENIQSNFTFELVLTKALIAENPLK